MLISELEHTHPKIYAEAVKQRSIAAKKKDTISKVEERLREDHLIAAFDWSQMYPKVTSEFWGAINRGDFDRARELNPEYFEEESTTYKGEPAEADDDLSLKILPI